MSGNGPAPPSPANPDLFKSLSVGGLKEHEIVDMDKYLLEEGKEQSGNDLVLQKFKTKFKDKMMIDMFRAQLKG